MSTVLGSQMVISPPFFGFNFSSPSGIAKHDPLCLQFADSACKFACGDQFCTFNEFRLFIFCGGHFCIPEYGSEKPPTP
jgi:hypothetical protein